MSTTLYSETASVALVQFCIFNMRERPEKEKINKASGLLSFKGHF